MPFDPMLFRQVLGRFATGVTVVTTHHSGTKHGKEGDQFADIPHFTKATGCPVLDECLAYIDCKVWARFDVGDHTLFVGEVQEAALREDANLKPLLFYASKYRRLADETP